MNSSHDIAKKYNKRHCDVLRKIKSLLERNVKLKPHFTLSESFSSAANRNVKYYDIDDVGIEILVSAYKYRNNVSSSIELEYIEAIKQVFPNAKMTTQKTFCGGKYRVDLVIEDTILVEIDEDFHKYQKDKDDVRINAVMEDIKKTLIEESPWLERLSSSEIVKVVRIKQGDLFKGINTLMNIMYEDSTLGHLI